jgi:alkanesulfonate monooxygenase SsuD/methylene tetrahydromethanopterin reductase-like flavin-dependent oxidoreductase (luciferase family)
VLAAAARTEQVELFTTVLNVGWRANPVLVAPTQYRGDPWR